MPSPSPEIIPLVSVFATAFTAPTFAKALILLCGTILAPGRRTVTAALRAMGLADDEQFTKYHRVLNRDRWSPWVLSKLLLGLIIVMFLPAGAPLILVVDETLERRRGRKTKYMGWFRDPLRSTAKHVTKALGMRWICLAVLVPVPWSTRLWALPFMSIPALGPKTSDKLKKRHRTLVEWAMIMIGKVRRWQPEREIVLVGDGSYAAVVLVRRCQRLKQPVKLVSRLRLDATLHDFPGPQPKSKRGPKPKKGDRQPSLAARLTHPKTCWRTMKILWYGGDPKEIEFMTGVSLWYRRGLPPAPIRWVLVRCPEASFKPVAFFCSDTDVSARHIVTWFIASWNIEVTFEELRAHLGFETQRQWSDKAIERTTPCLFGIFSLVVLMAKVQNEEMVKIVSRLNRKWGWIIKFPVVLGWTVYLKVKNGSLRRSANYLDHQQEFFGGFIIKDRCDKFHRLRELISAHAYGDGQNESVLEVATGYGWQAESLVDIGFERVVAIDVVPERVKFGRQLFSSKGIEFEVVDAQKLPYGDNSFDSVVITAALHDMPTEVKYEVLSEMIRVAKTKAVIFEPRVIKNYWGAWLYGAIGNILDESIHFRDYVSDDWTNVIKNYGWKVEDDENVWYQLMNVKTLVPSG